MPGLTCISRHVLVAPVGNGLIDAKCKIEVGQISANGNETVPLLMAVSEGRVSLLRHLLFFVHRKFYIQDSYHGRCFAES